MRSRSWLLPFVVASVVALCCPASFADEGDPTIKFPAGTTLMRDLHFSSVEVKKQETPVAVVAGQFTRKDWSLGTNFSLGQVVLSKQGKFQLTIPLKAIDTPVSIIAVGLRGETETQQFIVHYPLYAAKRGPKPKRFAFNPVLQFSSISYQESANSINVSELALTGKMGLDYTLSEKVHLGGSVYGTLVPMTNGNSLRFLGINIRATYYITPAERQWTLSVAGGLYYTTTLVTGGDFGFYNLSGPQIYPTLRRNYPKGDFMLGYFKYAMISYGSKLLSPAQNEVAFGLAYGFRQKDDRFISINLDIARLGLSIPEGNVSSTSISLGAGYGF